jgi:hypothetical protein
MLSILANRKIYTKVDQMKEEKRNMIHKLKPLQNESIRVVEELAITQSTMKLAVQDTKKKNCYSIRTNDGGDCGQGSQN